MIDEEVEDVKQVEEVSEKKNWRVLDCDNDFCEGKNE